MASPIGAEGSVAVKTDDKGTSIQIQISESAGVKAENLSLSTWGASFILSNLLHKIRVPALSSEHCNDVRLPQHPVLELGAGTGLVGLSAAMIWRTNVMLTDLSSILPGVSANIILNKSVLAEHAASASAASLDWTKPDTIHADRLTIRPEPGSKPSVILAADTIYDSSHPQIVSNTIRTWLAPDPTSRAILCYPLRMAYIDHIREFWELMEAEGLECTEEGREEGGEEWNEIANTPYEWCIWRWKES